MYAYNIAGERYTAADGTVYESMPDAFLTQEGDLNGESTTSEPIANTDDDALYQDQRYGVFTYDIPITNGNYEVVVQLAEPWADNANQRLMNVTIESDQVISNLDMISEVGKYVAYDRSFSDISVTDGHLTIRYDASENYGTASAVRIYTAPSDEPTQTPNPTTPPNVPTSTPTPGNIGEGLTSYNQTCVFCHGDFNTETGISAGGAGGSNPLNANNFVNSSTFTVVSNYIRDEMPPSPLDSSSCGQDCADDITAYIFSLATEAMSPLIPKRQLLLIFSPEDKGYKWLKCHYYCSNAFWDA